MKTNEIKLRSVATSLFDVQRWTFDVRCLACSMLDVHILKQALIAQMQRVNIYKKTYR